MHPCEVQGLPLGHPGISWGLRASDLDPFPTRAQLLKGDADLGFVKLVGWGRGHER